MDYEKNKKKLINAAKEAYDSISALLERDKIEPFLSHNFKVSAIKLKEELTDFERHLL